MPSLTVLNTPIASSALAKSIFIGPLLVPLVEELPQAVSNRVAMPTHPSHLMFMPFLPISELPGPLTGQLSENRPQATKTDGEQQDRAGRDLLVERGNLHQRHAVGDGAEHESADDRSGNPADAARQGRATEDHGGDRVQRRVGADGGCAGEQLLR